MSEEIKFKSAKKRNLRARRQSSDEDDDQVQEETETL